MSIVEKIGGWRQLEVEDVYENPWIKVTHETVKTPNHTDGIYGVVHFKTRAVGILPVDNKGCTWLVKQSRYALNEYTWEIPEGGAPLDEPPLVAAKRELREETGLSAKKWEPWLRLHLSNSVTDEEAMVYLATELSSGEMALEDTEDIQVSYLPLQQAIDMVMDGKITDAISVATLLKASKLLTA